jgi:Peptide chain release factor RF-3
MGSILRGIYHISEDKIYVYNKKINNSEESETKVIQSISSDESPEFLGADAEKFYEEVDLIKEVYPLKKKIPLYKVN